MSSTTSSVDIDLSVDDVHSSNEIAKSCDDQAEVCSSQNIDVNHNQSKKRQRNKTKEENEKSNDDIRLAKKRMSSRNYWRKKRSEENTVRDTLAKKEIRFIKKNEVLMKKNQELRDIIDCVRMGEEKSGKAQTLRRHISSYQQEHNVEKIKLLRSHLAQVPQNVHQLLYEKLLQKPIAQQLPLSQQVLNASSVPAQLQLGIPMDLNINQREKMHRNNPSVLRLEDLIQKNTNLGMYSDLKTNTAVGAAHLPIDVKNYYQAAIQSNLLNEINNQKILALIRNPDLPTDNRLFASNRTHVGPGLDRDIYNKKPSPLSLEDFIQSSIIGKQANFGLCSNLKPKAASRAASLPTDVSNLRSGDEYYQAAIQSCLLNDINNRKALALTRNHDQLSNDTFLASNRIRVGPDLDDILAQEEARKKNMLLSTLVNSVNNCNSSHPLAPSNQSVTSSMRNSTNLESNQVSGRIAETINALLTGKNGNRNEARGFL